MAETVRKAYAQRAGEYIELLGSMTAVHPSDRQLVDTWADAVTGPVIDAGCGPGHWTDHLARRGIDARGVDITAEFVAHARAAFPSARFAVGELSALDAAPGTQGGILSWYSLIHHAPSAIEVPIREFARVLHPGGELLLGFCEGPQLESFDHAVARAYRWPVPLLENHVRDAGFDVLESHTRTSPTHRPHGAIRARRTTQP